MKNKKNMTVIITSLVIGAIIISLVQKKELNIKPIIDVLQTEQKDTGE